jgi:hypothetical protein
MSRYTVSTDTFQYRASFVTVTYESECVIRSNWSARAGDDTRLGVFIFENRHGRSHESWVKSGKDFPVDSKRNASGSCRYVGISRVQVAPISESFRVADFRQPKSDQVPADEPALVDHQSARPRTPANIFASLCGMSFVIQSDAPAKPNRWFAKQPIVGERHSKERQWLHRGNAPTFRRAHNTSAGPPNCTRQHQIEAARPDRRMLGPRVARCTALFPRRASPRPWDCVRWVEIPF